MIPNILVIGKIRTGKGELVKILCQKYGYTNYTIATWLKKTINKHYGLVNPSKGDKIVLPNKTITYREVLQEFGELIRHFDNSWHIRELLNLVKTLPFCVDDVRYQNEIELIKEKYPNTITIKITSDENIRIQRICMIDSLVPTDKMNNHKSETELTDYVTDYIIDNSGSINELEHNINTIMEGLIHEK